MPTELDSLYSEQASACSKQQVLEDQIDRLRRAKNILSDYRGDLKPLKKDLQKRDEKSDFWAGVRFDSYLDSNNSLIDSGYYYYDGEVSDAIEDIKEKIRQLDNQLEDTLSGLSWLGRKIEDLIKDTF